jgi:hypothetical protein
MEGYGVNQALDLGIASCGEFQRGSFPMLVIQDLPVVRRH